MIDSLRIGAHIVPVIPKPDDPECGEYKSGGGQGPRIHMGVSAGEPGSLTYNVTLFHEAIHCISELYELNLNEAKVRTLEQTLTCLFRDNPDFLLSYAKSLSEG